MRKLYLVLQSRSPGMTRRYGGLASLSASSRPFRAPGPTKRAKSNTRVQTPGIERTETARNVFDFAARRLFRAEGRVKPQWV